MRIILLTGISGSGKSVGLNALEDAGYFCVDNLPPSLLRALVETRVADGAQKLAIAVDARSASSLVELPETINWMKSAGHAVDVIFLTAKTESLINRFSETRRSHPLSHRIAPDASQSSLPTLIECIRQEREVLSAIEGLGHQIDTSGLTANQLRGWIKDLIQSGQNAPLSLLFESFAFKYGVPLDADLVFDVRVVPNPFYDKQLRPLTGKDQAVIEFLKAQPEGVQLLKDIRAFVEKWLPAFERDNRSYLTVAIGCTGGQHRSVFFVEQLAELFRARARVLVRHRELD
ncbi:MAG: RNase adapter RapZ [Betaproteobacteria bacterium]|nr:RNase adapter RapZ [Betaproteobacteria bacterium]